MPALDTVTERRRRHRPPSLRVVLSVVLFGFSTAGVAATPPRIDAQATVDLPGIEGKNEYTAVVHSGDELSKLMGKEEAAAALIEASAALKTKGIDFDKQVLLVASPPPKLGETPARIEVSQFVEKDGEWLVRWRITYFQLKNQTVLPARRGVLCLIGRTDAPLKFLSPSKSGR
jgi:hypothetical protein